AQPEVTRERMNVDSAYRTVEDYLSGRRAALVREPVGGLRRPFIDPSSVYTGQLWDWDAYFTLLALQPHLPVAPVARDCVQNFIEHQRDDGSMPYRIAADSTPGGERRPDDSPFNSAKPVLAQMALLGARDDPDWAAAALPALRSHTRHWEQTQHCRNGLFCWRSHRGSGADNHPGVYGRPLNATAGIDLNCLFVAEYRALASLCAAAGDAEHQTLFSSQAEQLAERVRHLLWDPVAEDFCHADVLSSTPEGVNQEADWAVPLRYRSWVGFYALWAGVATRAQAQRLVSRVFSSDDLVCEHGLRTLSSREPLFHLSRSANPSNWQGPVWVMSNYIAFSGLLRNGFTPQARHILEGTLTMLARDIERHGTLHEYYHPDTGEGLMNPGFLNWNLLATTMHREFAAATAEQDAATAEPGQSEPGRSAAGVQPQD
ncbi:MAG: amylo-alpha-1,6-glucosidase, partial [Micromonosporaceae bacterium]